MKKIITIVGLLSIAWTTSAFAKNEVVCNLAQKTGNRVEILKLAPNEYRNMQQYTGGGRVDLTELAGKNALKVTFSTLDFRNLSQAYVPKKEIILDLSTGPRGIADEELPRHELFYETIFVDSYEWFDTQKTITCKSPFSVIQE